MSADTLISRLDGVRARGAGRWIAKCPAHPDKSPSLVVTEQPDGRTLLYCHAQCGAAAVLDALGLQFSDLYPPRPQDHVRPERRRLHPSDALEVASADAMLVSTYACMMVDRGALSDEEAAQLLAASSRITNAYRLALG